ncbi:MAG: SLC13 family permease [Deltaproteobacteria bacterium]
MTRRNPEGTITEAEEKFERARKTAGTFLAPLGFLICYFAPIGGITPEAQALLAVVCFTITCWMTECVPIPVAALLGPTLAVLLGVDSAKNVYATFADPVVILMLGSFIIAKAMTAQGLDRRLALGILSIKFIGASASSIMLGVVVVVAAVSMWVSNSATTAMMFPIVLGILGALGSVLRERGGEYRTGLMLLVAYSASIGGIASPVGSPPNLITLGMLDTLAGVKIGFLQWMTLGLPIAAVMLAFLWLYMSRICPAPVSEFGVFSQFISQERRILGRWRRGEINVLIVFAVAVGLWVAPGFLSLAFGADSGICKFFDKSLPESVAAILASAFLFILPVNWTQREFTLDLRDAMAIDWGVLLLFGGGISLGGMMFKTGLAQYLGNALVGFTGADSLVSITALGLFLAIVLSEATSNTAAANMLIPLIIAIAMSAGINPTIPALAAGIGASFGFMLPVSTPPNAIVYSSGLIPITRMIKYGFLVDVIGYFVVLIAVLTICPLIGLG